MTYYVDSIAGNDSGLGTSQATAWKTLSKVNSTSLSPGDNILLKCGSVFNTIGAITDGGAGVTNIATAYFAPASQFFKGTIVAGSGYTNNTYSATAMTGGSGTGMIATITVAGNVVTSVIITTTGTGYKTGDVLSATIAGGSGFTYTLTTNNYTAYFDTGAVRMIGSLRAASVKVDAVTFANLPASPSEGTLVPVTDSNTVTWRATIAGGGGNHVLAYYNGTNWTVAA